MHQPVPAACGLVFTAKVPSMDVLDSEYYQVLYLMLVVFAFEYIIVINRSFDPFVQQEENFNTPIQSKSGE
jgi:hypothetical protein